MNMYVLDQVGYFSKHLDVLKKKRVAQYDKACLVEKKTTIEINTKKKIDQLNLDVLFNYRIFPKSIMTAGSQWREENRNMKVGDTIVQQVYIPPVKSVSLKLIFGVRVSEIIDQVDRKGFSYETLKGHVEKGISTFTVEQFEGKIIFTIWTYSKPGNFLTKLLGPIFSVPYQTFCTKAALNHVKRQMENQ